MPHFGTKASGGMGKARKAVVHHAENMILTAFDRPVCVFCWQLDARPLQLGPESPHRSLAWVLHDSLKHPAPTQVTFIRQPVPFLSSQDIERYTGLETQVLCGQGAAVSRTCVASTIKYSISTCDKPYLPEIAQSSLGSPTPTSHRTGTAGAASGSSTRRSRREGPTKSKPMLRMGIGKRS